MDMEMEAGEADQNAPAELRGKASYKDVAAGAKDTSYAIGMKGMEEGEISDGDLIEEAANET